MASSVRQLTRVIRPAVASPLARPFCAIRPFSMSVPFQRPHDLYNPPKGGAPQTPKRGPPTHPSEGEPPHYLGTNKRMPEFNLSDKVVLVSGAARGLGLVQAEALLEAGATVYALDRLEEPSPDFYRIQKRAAEELQTTLYYRQIDVTDVPNLNSIVEKIGEEHGRLDGLIAAAGIQQETPALEYTPEDCNKMLQVNVTGVFMTSQAVAKQMIKFGNGGSIVLIASMSATVANRVSDAYCRVFSSTANPLTCNFRPAWNGLLESESLADCLLRVSSARHTMPQRPVWSNLRVTWHQNGACTASESTQSRQAISSPPWLRSCSRHSPTAARLGPNRTCLASSASPRSTAVRPCS